eukprot:77311-Pleurochrysis_carterae.AAC.1
MPLLIALSYPLYGTIRQRRPPACQMQAECRRRSRGRPPQCPASIPRAAVVIALLACAPAHVPTLHLIPVSDRPVDRSSTRHQ